jgi:hypothetical protein
MNKLMLMGGAALLAMSGMAGAQSSPAPDATPPDATPDAAAMPAAPNDATTPAAPAAAPAEAAPATAAADTAAAPAPNAAPADQMASAPAPGTPTAVSADAAAKVNAEWAKYDEGNKGKLTPLEFGNWIKASQGADKTAQVEKTAHGKASNLPAVKVLNETATQFAKADTDHDKAISPNELAAFLSA